MRPLKKSKNVKLTGSTHNISQQRNKVPNGDILNINGGKAFARIESAPEALNSIGMPSFPTAGNYWPAFALFINFTVILSALRYAVWQAKYSFHTRNLLRFGLA